MGNRNKKVVRITPKGMMDEAIKDITDVSEEVMNQLEIKKGMLQTVLDTAEEGFNSTGVSVSLRLAEDGYEFLFSDLHDYMEDLDDDDDDDDEEFSPIEMFSGEDEDGTSYSAMVVLTENPDDDESFDMNIALFRTKDGEEQVLADQGWISQELAAMLDD